ncbi:hypothetical protein PICMEDRAFT_70737 [Pichia membranifaciens NRRL Y-2026]|uniref:BHLH domain-containing protein n=1 Tax=Pichia membranifaciens NRRL Y-2026 TaxID=763406 RepID=A0A1E3NU24_9ASCO|nr:hypothetical protein PICMEDRAFT_70737 [Pichia membranifaciens NRRL Y-2026]ODQ49178.1 hypothetical protein PICMEDRAFT_70737 [Pichia membranifaciens NRRL Y-2026]
MSRNGSNNFVNDFNSPNSNFLNTNSSSTTPFTNDSNGNLNTGHEDFGNFNDFSTSGNTNGYNEDWDQISQNVVGNARGPETNIQYTNSLSNFGFVDTNNTDIQPTQSPAGNFLNPVDLEEFDKQFIDSLMDESVSNNNNMGSTNDMNRDATSRNPVDININGLPIVPNNFSMNTVNNSSNNNESLSNSVYQSPQPISTSLARDSSSLRTDAFSPQSLGFSTNFTSHKLGKTISNTLAKSYGSQLGTSLNNLISPSSTYEGFLDSPYGSYNDDSLKSPINSPSFKGIGSPSSVATHLNPKSALSKENKLSRRRELHNAVERRRRDLIKEKIKELGALIPPSMLYDISKSKNTNKDTKANKNIILNKSVDYILYLKEILEAQDKRLAELDEQVEQLNLNDKLAEESEAFNNKNNTTENYTYDNSISPNNADMNESHRGGNGPNTDLDSFQKNLKAFTENVDIKPSESKLKFMDFSNAHSEPVDFKQLSESYKKYPRADNMDPLLNLEQVDLNQNNNANDNFDGRLSFSTKHNEFDNLNSIPSPVSNFNNNNTNKSEEIASPEDLDRLLNEPGLKFKSDAEFLDQLLSKESVGGFGN